MTRLRSPLAVVFVGLIVLAIALDFVHSDLVGVDFHTYEAAATVGLQQGWSHLYDEGAVAAAQRRLDPELLVQPFLSPPPVAWLAALFTPLPFQAAYLAWAVLSLAALTAAFAWSTLYPGAGRWIAVAAAFVPWWVLHAIHLGQVAPLVAAAVLVAWRLLREDRDVAAGLVLLALLLKPNTALLVPVALLVTGRSRAFLAWLIGTAVLALASVAIIGPHGVSAYMADLGHITEPEIRGASQLTLGLLFGLSPPVSAVVRGTIVVAALATMFRYRREPAMAIATGAVASLLTTTYLHGSDLCLLLAAGWIAWHERPDPIWRALLGGVWLLATPILDGSPLAPPLNRWVLCELAVMAALLVDAWAGRPLAIWRRHPLTPWAASGRQAPA